MTYDDYERYVRELAYSDAEFHVDIKKCHSCARNLTHFIPPLPKNTCIAGGVFARILRGEFERLTLKYGDVDIFPYGSDYTADSYYTEYMTEILKGFSSYIYIADMPSYASPQKFHDFILTQYHESSYSKSESPKHSTRHLSLGSSATHGITFKAATNTYNLILDPACLALSVEGTLDRFDARHTTIAYDIDNDIMVCDKIGMHAAKNKLLVTNYYNSGMVGFEDYRRKKFISDGYRYLSMFNPEEIRIT